MKTVAVLGNCQAEALQRYLIHSANFSRYFKIIGLPAIYRYSQEDYFERFSNIISESDLIIYQPLSPCFGKLSADSIKSMISSSCEMLSFPSMFFTGYNPEVAYIRDPELRSLDYVDRILWGLCENNKTELFKSQIVASNYFPRKFSEDCLELTLNESKNREQHKSLDVRMSDFIENNFHKERLFHVLNHPTPITLRELANRIIKSLGLDADLPDSFVADELEMKNFSFPIYASHHANLGLEFNHGNHVYFNEFNVDDYLKFFINRFGDLRMIADNNSAFFSFELPKSRSDSHIIGEMESEIVFC